ncbi:type II toxin-antitoxin system RelE/ParE family toxin [Flavobacterium quisquiliarum]|jgi:plasmid stabilization system protein ParE|uniref:Type II toxin-antitoxin system RelE/ParE family toxin n=1 Tax=Flavobacterium quisquiliarum TaxID=1834436 RepID=A0ABV8W9V5_9FLAO|nr:type II toxin-antitoxin system RelE/ParE family toxin [Flavobacterium quisquiliarum]MBW1654149.1 type II toxin-antitoxin system RelE/ParE family toxin [Flavobacterium quisquiliarum]NWL00859.1 type II toxin-antitoxin system RelE/ParE family toxin [Flavobacterium collinsii]
MKLKIVWSQFAENEIDKIYEYYLYRAGIRVAKKIIKEIISEPNKLVSNNLSTQTEELLLDRENEYHYLVCKNYKIIYHIDKENKLIQIADVFDTRQNPVKLKRTK